ncbi:hypothetical protein H5410_001168, partial [Solanum commersonii]
TSGEDEDGILKTLKAAAFQEKIEMKFEKSEVSIPHEIIFEIFSWLPVKSLMRFNSSRTNFLLHDGIFFYAADLKEDENISASLLLTERLHTYSGLNCANGLFCVWEQYNRQPALIFNPSTREVRFLLDPNKGRSCGNYLIGFEPQENKYKVLLSEEEFGFKKRWVLTLGIDESWREIQNIYPYFPYGKPSVCINEVIYHLVRSVQHYELIEVKGKLAIVDYHRVKSFDLWILEHSPTRELKRRNIPFPSKWNYKLYSPISSIASCDGKIVFICENPKDSCWCYDVSARRRRWRKLEIKGFPEETSIHDIYNTHRCRCVTHPGGTKFLKEHEKYSVQIQSFDAIPFNIPHLKWPRLNCVNQPAAILNPSTREVRLLPSLIDDFCLWHYSFGFEPEEKKYKIIATTNHVRGSYTERWVFTLGIDESWREVNSSFHNFAFHNEFVIAGFDVKSEIFKFSVLGNNATPWCHYELIEVKGKLAAIHHKKRRT